ncbi:tetratricopeptide repeat protein [Aureispira anguillae]|uniref:Tetratricopeptide repeat protein n=1 Tax=Aureispira anguillae TaxID=2864201 RepID=A0A915VK92_9BACT|nr:hypothetical protein [Aureispira anguillae]BDS09573.1 hypothetical protein AsAng_0002770 [Aureispira anguillae]
MELYEEAFGCKKPKNTKKRTFGNLFKGLKSNYLKDYQSAIADYNSNNLTSALNNINNTIKKADINDWKHYAFRANLYETSANYNQAIEDYQTAIGYSESDIDVYALYHQIGFCYLSLGNNQKGYEFFSYAIDLKSNHPNSQLNPDQEGMDMGVLLGVTFKKMYVNRGSLLFNMNNLNESLEDCKKSLSYDQNYSNPYMLLAQIFNKAGQEDEAMKYLKISAQLGNRNAISALKQMGLL